MNNNINFNEVEFPRYMKVKDSIEELIKIMNLEEVKNDGVDRVLHAFLQLIDENDDKIHEEKYEEIKDALYNGNVFKHYFKEEDLEKAVEILSNTVLLNDQERLIYIINFYMPNDTQFTNVYKETNKDVSKIAEYYGFSGEESYDFIFARALELNKFYSEYRAEKERQKLYNEAANFEEKQDEVEEVSVENVESIENEDLNESLEEQSPEVESEDVSMFEEVNEQTIDEIVPTTQETPLEPLQDELVEQMQEVVVENNEVPTEESLEEPFQEDFMNEMLTGVEVEEPKPLEEVLEQNAPELEEQPDVREEVMASLQTLVANSRENAQKVEQLSLELVSKEEELNAKNEELAEKDRMLDEGNTRIQVLEQELSSSKAELETARQTIEAQNNQINTLNRTLYAHQEYLVQLQTVLSGAQNVANNEEEVRKLR